MQLKSLLVTLTALPIALAAQNTYIQNYDTPSYGYTTGVGSAGTGTTTTTGTSLAPTASTLLQQIYPEPPQSQAAITKNVARQVAAEPKPQPQIVIQALPVQKVAPAHAWIPGLATVRNDQWVTTDYLGYLTDKIDLKVEVITSEDSNVQVSEKMVEKQVRGLLEGAKIHIGAEEVPCMPNLPIFHVVVAAFSCDIRDAASVTIQLFENATPVRIHNPLNGVWQLITFQRQTIVVAPRNDFAHELELAIAELVGEFTNAYRFYHKEEVQPCDGRPLIRSRTLPKTIHEPSSRGYEKAPAKTVTPTTTTSAYSGSSAYSSSPSSSGYYTSTSGNIAPLAQPSFQTGSYNPTPSTPIGTYNPTPSSSQSASYNPTPSSQTATYNPQ